VLVEDLGQPVLPKLQNGAPVSGGPVAAPVPPAPFPLRAPGIAPDNTKPQQ
jgi:general secretion pathway protein D